MIYTGLFDSLHIGKRLLYRLKVHRPKKGISWKQFWNKDADFSQAAYTVSHIGLIGHSGGTTGSPKSILLRDQALNGLVQECRNVIPPKKNERFLCAVIPFVLYGICVNLHFPLSLGNEVILVPKVDNEIISKLLKKYRPNHVCSVPSVWSAFSQSKELENENLSYLVSVISGGDAMSMEQEKQINMFIKSHSDALYVSKAFVVLKHGTPASDDMKDYIMRKSREPFLNSATGEMITLKEYEAPASVSFLDALPRNKNSDKVDYLALEEMAKEKEINEANI